MNTDELKTFLNLSETLNFTKTAEEMHLSQSTVSARIQNLESYLGKKLLVREKKGIYLTWEGTMFLKSAKQILQLEEDLFQEIHMQNHFKDKLSISSVQYLMDYCLTDYLERYCAANPDISVDLQTGHSENIIPMLLNGLIDIAIVSYPTNNAGLLCFPFVSDDVILVGQSRIYHCVREGIDKKELRELPLIYSDIWDTYLADTTGHVLSDQSIFPFRCNMLHNAKEFCIRGTGCCFLPKFMVKKEIEAGILTEIPVQGLSLTQMHSYIIYHKNRTSLPALKAWLQMFPELS